MTRDELVQTIAGALAPHAIECTSIGEVTCRCHESGWMPWSAHRAHQAAAVADTLAEHLAQAWDEGAHAAWAQSCDGWNAQYPGDCAAWGATWSSAPNPYRATESKDHR